MIDIKPWKFSDLYDVHSGISTTSEQAGKGAPFLSYSAVYNNYFIPDLLEDLMDTSLDEQKRYSIKEGDIFLTRTSEVVDELAISSIALKDYPGATFSGFLKRLRPKQQDIAYYKYLAFYLRGYLFRKAMNNNSILTLRASFNEQMFSYLELLLPPFEVQVEIGDFLYAIEQKIKLNNRINAELESLAKLIYDYWFVQFDFPDENGCPYKSSGGKMVYNEALKREIPEGWGDGLLEDIIEIHDSKRVPLSKRERQKRPGPYPYYGATTVMDFIDDYLFDGVYVLLAEDGSVMDSNGKPVLQYIWGKTWVNNHAHVLEGKLGFSNEYLLLTLKNIPVIQMMSGSIQKKINQKNLRMVKICKPDKKILQIFQKIISPMYEKLILLNKQNQVLIELRDWLLPMLMNGQVRVGE